MSQNRVVGDTVQTAPPQQRGWDYKVLADDPSTVERSLKGIGAEGWELVNSTIDSDGRCHLFLKLALTGSAKSGIDRETIYLTEYGEVNDFIRHYSSVRSGIVSFLVTVGGAAFGVYFQLPNSAPPEAKPFLALFGTIAIAAAIIANLRFAYLTGRSELYSTVLWRWFQGTLTEDWYKKYGKLLDGQYPPGFRSKDFRAGREAFRRAFWDLMTLALNVAALIVLVAFFRWSGLSIQDLVP